MKKIGIIGSGIVAQTLGAGFLKHGYQVMLGTRDASKLAEWQNGPGANALVGSFADAASFGEIIVLAVKGSVAKNALNLMGHDNISNKTVIDASNPISDAPPTNGVLKFFTTLDRSLMEELQETVPSANFVKAFNSVGSGSMVNPSYESKPTMFICGNNENAKKEVSIIIDTFGWEASDFGMVESARAIEPLCMLWCIIGFTNNQWSHAFKLLKR
ncbi:MAG: NAD(P)-binding domain-containing protein [Saprospiraceae bacterium]|nr:NAD(P)-binding domain-containing protein [Saprospiraceae bacterium]